MALTIPLVPLDAATVRGIYNGGLPARMRWLAPDAAQSFATIADRLVLSDMYRSADGSLSAMLSKSGVQPPGFSRHGFGRAIDLDVGQSKKRWGCAYKSDLDRGMAALHWYCHRRDNEEGPECWHYNFLPGGLDALAGETSTAPAGERELRALFWSELNPTDAECQALLAGLGMYHGAIDGKVGALSQVAADVFSRAWHLPDMDHGFDGRRFRRTLAFCAAGAPVAA